MKLSGIWDALRAEKISNSYTGGDNLTHTIQMVDAAERTIPEQDKESELLRRIEELNLVYRECREQLSPAERGIVEQILESARTDVKQGEYWCAIMDVFEIETEYLQKYLPKTPFLDEAINAPRLLVKKGLGSLGIEVKEYDYRLN